MNDWDAQTILTLIGGVAAMLALWGVFLWSLGRQKD
jgi:hypothetical protein